MTDPEKVTPPADTPETPESTVTEPANADTVSASGNEAPDEVAASAPADPDEGGLPTVAEGEPVEVLSFVPPVDAVVEPVVPAAVTTTRRAKQAVKVDEAPARYAVIKTGGKQYRVKVGDRIQVERLHADAGTDVTIDQVLMLGGTGSTLVGTPVVDGASVTAHIDEHGRGEKIVVFKFKAKKRYRRRTGHRQELTRLTITGISG